MGKTFAPDDKVIYGSNGVCTMVEITQKDFGGQSRDYYVLRPASFGTSVFYVPVDSQLTSRIRPVKDAAQLDRLIAACRVTEEEWIPDDRARQAQIKSVMEDGDTPELLHCFKLLMMRQRSLAQCGKKLRAVDERLLHEIETILTDELLLATALAREDAAAYLLGEAEIRL